MLDTDSQKLKVVITCEQSNGMEAAISIGIKAKSVFRRVSLPLISRPFP